MSSATRTRIIAPPTASRRQNPISALPISSANGLIYPLTRATAGVERSPGQFVRFALAARSWWLILRGRTSPVSQARLCRCDGNCPTLPVIAMRSGPAGCHGQIRPAYWRCRPHRADGAWHRHPETRCRCPVHPCQATGPAGASAPPLYSPCECRLPAGLTERDGIGMVDPGSAQRVPREGLDHWSSRCSAALPRTRWSSAASLEPAVRADHPRRDPAPRGRRRRLVPPAHHRASVPPNQRSPPGPLDFRAHGL